MCEAGQVEARGMTEELRGHTAGRSGKRAEKVELRHGLCAALLGAEVFLRVRPMLRETGAQQHNDAIGQTAMLLLPCLKIAHSYAVVGVRGRLGRHIDDHRRTDALLHRQLVHRLAFPGKVDRRTEVRTTVLGGAVAVGGYTVAYVR